ncbi:glycoside hydrolase [Mariniflexile jejuense]|uniref:Glycoside hydrolase n=1 Tax=Mariniflexile jejuense TaxID=1173582 RepID=A0ABW3JL92_9FLAO
MKKQLLIVILVLIVSNSWAQKKDLLGFKIDKTITEAIKQYSFLKTNVPLGLYPKTYHSDNDKLETSTSSWWCSGFYPGTLIYLNEASNSQIFTSDIKSILNDLKKEQYNKSTHDLGFMMYCSFGNAIRLNANTEYENVLMNSAKSLASRYNDTVKCIRSWDSASWNKAGEDDLVVIIDNMMNLEMLFWATKQSGDSLYYNVAVNHADKTLKNHFRNDYSSFHEVIYDEKTGKVKAQITNQGAADNSSWARGQAWGLYGYTVMYRETKDVKYLKHAQRIANYILNHSNLPKDKIPYWDFNAPNIPNALRDSSAAAIIASALLELSEYSNKKTKKHYFNEAKTILDNLLTPEYISEMGKNGGFLLKHGVGNMPKKTEIDTPLSYGDYYLIEAMIRYKNQLNQL